MSNGSSARGRQCFICAKRRGRDNVPMPFVLRPWPPSPTFLVCSPARNTCTPRALSTPYLASQQGVRFPTDLRSGISHACTKQTSPLIRPFVKDTFRQKRTLHVRFFARLARLTMREMLYGFHIQPGWETREGRAFPKLLYLQQPVLYGNACI